ncbi:MAG TPA: hypothetical protein VII94_04980 [Candidatus Saccharimonadales bacterium]
MKTKKSSSRTVKSVKKPTRTTKISKKHVKNHKKVLVKRRIKQSRPFYKKLILHPFSVFLILCMVVFVCDWTFRVIADSYTVTAAVLAPALQEGATITSVTNNQKVSLAPIIITGSCPANSYVNLYINSLFSGTALCVGQTFTIKTELFTGLNTLTAKDYNVTNVQGPTTPSLNIILTTSSINSSTPTSQPLLLISSFSYQTFITNSLFSWQINIEGGKPPYKLNVNWGDGSSSNLVFSTDPTFTINHKYTNPGYFVIDLSATDANKSSQIIQLSALIKSAGSASVLSTNTSKIGPIIGPTASPNGLNKFFESSKNWLWAAWSSLGVVLLMLASFLLGERQQRSTLLRRR